MPTTGGAERLVRTLEGRETPRALLRADDKVTTVDCPIGARAKLRSQLIAMTSTAPAVAIPIATFGCPATSSGCGRSPASAEERR